MILIDKIFETLDNGNWHELAEVAEKTSMQESKVELISSFLSAYDFLEYDKKTRRIKLSTQLKTFLKKVRNMEQEEATEK